MPIPLLPFDPLRRVDPLAGPVTDSAITALRSAANPPFKVTLKAPNGTIWQSGVERGAAEKIAALLAKHSLSEQRTIIDDLKRQITDQRKKETLEFAEKLREIKEAEAARDIMHDLRSWWTPPGASLERTTESRAHALLAAVRSDRIVIFKNLGDSGARASLYAVDTAPSIGQPFVVEHDWASAFRAAGDYADGNEYKLPYDHVCFELKLGGRHVCALASNDAAGQIVTALFVELVSMKGAWLHLDDGTLWKPVISAVHAQIKAICVSLEAEVAQTEIIRAPYKLNRAREKAGKIPVFDHRVVRLAHRNRPMRLIDAAPSESAHKRLHFRRGHWRHYKSHKIWIRWMLVGDPDLGFVDKEYRL